MEMTDSIITMSSAVIAELDHWMHMTVYCNSLVPYNFRIGDKHSVSYFALTEKYTNNHTISFFLKRNLYSIQTSSLKEKLKNFLWNQIEWGTEK